MRLGHDGGKCITADYDFLAFGQKGPHVSPDFNPNTGFITKEQEEILAEVNKAAKDAGYAGGNVSHHGAETFYPGSPGAMKVDPVVTALDPKKGMVTIPRCDIDCMDKWCMTTKLCNGLPVCGQVPKQPCMPVDPDRLLKDFFHAKRLEGYNLDPNPVWNWGNYRVTSGWTVGEFLEEGIPAQAKAGQIAQATVGLASSARRAMVVGMVEGVKWFFECSRRADGTMPERRE